MSIKDWAAKKQADETPLPALTAEERAVVKAFATAGSDKKKLAAAGMSLGDALVKGNAIRTKLGLSPMVSWKEIAKRIK